MLERVLIIGGGVAAMRCALELRTQGYDGRICMVSAETTLPYDRTLVSKELLSGDRVDEARLLLQPSEAYEDAAIDLRLGVSATGLDVRTRRVDLADGTQLGYDRLMLAVGGEPVRPPRLTAPGVLTLRELGDARRLADMLDAAGRIVIVGGGFIGTRWRAWPPPAACTCRSWRPACPSLRCSAETSRGASATCTAPTAWTCSRRRPSTASAAMATRSWWSSWTAVACRRTSCWPR